MRKSKHFSAKLSLFLAAILLVSFAATPVFAADYKHRIACSHKPVSPWVQAAQYFEKELEALTGGRVDVTVHHSATLGNTREVCEMVRNNTLEAAIPGSAQLSTYCPHRAGEIAVDLLRSNCSRLYLSGKRCWEIVLPEIPFCIFCTLFLIWKGSSELAINENQNWKEQLLL